MEFEQLQVIWNTQDQEPLYTISEAKLIPFGLIDTRELAPVGDKNGDSEQLNFD